LKANVPAGQMTARGIAVAHADREGVICAGVTEVEDVDSERDVLLLADLGRAGDMRVITGDDKPVIFFAFRFKPAAGSL